MNSKIYKLAMTSMFAALTCVATMVIQIPSPTNGYLNLGDCMVLVSAWCLGPLNGFLAAAIGSAFADIFSGYVIYAPATFLIKGLVALVAVYIAKALIKSNAKFSLPKLIISSIAGESIMVIGYCIYDSLIFDEGFIAGIPGNSIQAVFGIIAGIAIFKILSSTKLTSKINSYIK